MGIKNLLKELMPLSENVDLAKYRDRRVAIDGAGWLYRVRLSDPSQLDGLMDEAAYRAFVG